MDPRERQRAQAVKMSGIPFGTTTWADVEPTEHKGEKGTATWRTRNFGAIRVRLVEYSAGYVSNHWCDKGHILLCLEGRLETELRDGRRFALTPGVSYQVADGAEAHRSSTVSGAKLFIVD
jgi:quercetin dioxygenase-like cupin family protein